MIQGASYARVSTDGQEENYSTESQQAACRTYASKYNISLIEEIADVETGTILDRKGLARLIALARAGAIKAVVVYCVDRVARDMGTYYFIRGELQRHGVALHYVTKGEIQQTADGVLQDGLDALIAQMELLRITERTKRGKRAKVERGEVLGAGLMPPYGYVYAGEKKTTRLEVVPHEAQTIAMIFRWYLDGMSVHAIVTKLSDMRVPTPGDGGRRVNRRQRAAGMWNVSTVNRMLRNEAYTGTAYQFRYMRINKKKIVERPKEEWIAVSCPIIVDPHTFQLAQNKLSQGKAMSKRNSKTFYLLGRRLTCDCGHAYTGEVSKGTRTYRCNARGRNAVERCSMGSIKADTIEPLVWRWMLQELTPKRLQVLLTQEHKQHEVIRNELQRELDAQGKALGEIEVKLQRIRSAFVSGLFSEDEARQEKDAVIGHQRTIQQEMERLRNRIAATGPTAEEAAQLVTALEHLSQEVAHIASDDDRRFLIDKLDIRVAIRRDDSGLRYAQATGRFQLESPALPLDGIQSTMSKCCGLPQQPPPSPASHAPGP